MVQDSESLTGEAAVQRGNYTARPRSPAAAFRRISTVHF